MNRTTQKDKGMILTAVGITLMILLILTQFTPSAQLAGYSVFVGLASFFLAEWLSKTPEAKSGLRFTTFFADLKKCGLLLWLVIPVVSAIGSILLGNLLFQNGYVDHVLGRTDTILTFENALILFGQLLVAGLGEEIAFRGFFTGKGMTIVGFWPAALTSSVFFALAHLSAGDPAIVAYDLAGIFFDAMIYSLIYRKTENCLISTVSHFLVNAVGLLFVFAFLR